MIEKDLVDILKKHNLTIGSIESFTGGLFASTLTNVPGASKVYLGSIVTYATDMKIKLLGVDNLTIASYGVVSKEVAREMAEKGRQKLGVDICVSFTGNAGPGTLDNLPVGRVCMAIAASSKTLSYEVQIEAHDRQRVRELAVESVMKWVIEYIRQETNMLGK